MAPWVKLLIGLVAALAAASIHHGPMGHGEALVRGLEARAEQMVGQADIAGVEVRMQRGPLARTALLSGPADRFQREGQGSFPGLNERVSGIRGMGAVVWTDEGGADGLRLPLLAETLLLALGAWLIGLGLGFLLFGRRRKTSYLGD